jgi:hypothetical protein
METTEDGSIYSRFRSLEGAELEGGGVDARSTPPESQKGTLLWIPYDMAVNLTWNDVAVGGPSLLAHPKAHAWPAVRLNGRFDRVGGQGQTRMDSQRPTSEGGAAQERVESLNLNGRFDRVGGQGQTRMDSQRSTSEGGAAQERVESLNLNGRFDRVGGQGQTRMDSQRPTSEGGAAQERVESLNLSGRFGQAPGGPHFLNDAHRGFVQLYRDRQVCPPSARSYSCGATSLLKLHLLSYTAPA